MDHRLMSPLFWSVFAGWTLSVVLHEFAHGIVAYWGGDYTIRERGGLTLNPLQYVHPIYSIVLPLVFLMMGGLPLVGGATYVRRDLLRSRGWDAAVSLAGPAMNFLLFLACALPMHPKWGWIHPLPGDELAGMPAVLATMTRLQLLAVFFNLLPVPPLDGFQTLAAFMDDQQRAALMSPTVIMISTVLLFGVLSRSDALMQRFFTANHNVMAGLGFDPETLEYIRLAANAILTGST
jgi:Zn-dependent protease